MADFTMTQTGAQTDAAVVDVTTGEFSADNMSIGVAKETLVRLKLENPTGTQGWLVKGKTLGNSGTNGGVSMDNSVGSSPNFQGSLSDVITFFVRGDGDVTNTNNSYGAISDSRLKRNIDHVSQTKAKQMASAFDQVLFATFNMLDHGENAEKRLGVIAQEIYELFPSLVVQSDMTEFGGLEDQLSVKYSVLTLISEITLQQTRIELKDAQLQIDTMNDRLDAAGL